MTRNFSVQGSAKLKPCQIPAPCRNTSGSPLAGGEHDRFHAVDGVGLALESCAGNGWAGIRALLSLLGGDAVFAAARARMRGITSCASRLRFFTTFQCVMLPMRAENVEMVCAHHLAPLLQLLDHLVGGADGDEERFVDRIEIEPTVQFVGERGALLQLIDREIAGRRKEGRRGAQRVLEEIADVLDRFLLGLLLGLRDIDDDAERKLLRPDLVAVFGRTLGAVAD